MRTQVSTFGSPSSASGLGSCQLVSPHSKCWGQARPAAGHGFPGSWAGCQLAERGGTQEEPWRRLKGPATVRARGLEPAPLLVGGEEREWFGRARLLTSDLPFRTRSPEYSKHMQARGGARFGGVHGRVPGGLGTEEVREGEGQGPPGTRGSGFLVLSAPKIRMTFGCCLRRWA